MRKKPYRFINVRVKPCVHKTLKTHCVKKNISMSAYIEKILLDIFKKL